MADETTSTRSMNLAKIEENKNNLVIKNQELIHNARYTLSPLALKVISILISMINKDDVEFKKYFIRLKDFTELINSKSKNTYKYSHSLISELLSNPIKIDDAQMNWISYGKYKKGEGVITFEIHRELKPYLLQIKNNFIKYNVMNILPLKSSYIMRLYEICKDKLEEGTRYKKVKKVNYELSIENMRELFSIPKSYQYSSGIKLRILDKAVEQFKKNTDIQISYEDVKIGRRTDSIILTIEKNNKGSNDYLSSKQSFISYMRENYVNADILYATDSITHKMIIISISPDGHLYSKSGEEYDAKKSNQIWDSIYKIALEDKLAILQTSKAPK